MTSHNTPHYGFLAEKRTVGSDAGRATVVLVADRDPATTDRIASHLRSRYSVRTAYAGEELLASLDDSVAVLLLDPALLEFSPVRIVRKISEADLSCQVALLTEGDPDVPAAFDERLDKPLSAEDVHEAVDRLYRRADYRATLEKYYSLVAMSAGDDRAVPAEDDLDGQIASLRSDLDASFDALDNQEAYYAALRDIEEV